MPGRENRKREEEERREVEKEEKREYGNYKPRKQHIKVHNTLI